MFTGSVTIDMGKMVGQEEVQDWYPLSGQTQTKNARIECSFMVYDVDGPGPVMSAKTLALYGQDELSDDSPVEEVVVQRP